MDSCIIGIEKGIKVSNGVASSSTYFQVKWQLTGSHFDGEIYWPNITTLFYGRAKSEGQVLLSFWWLKPLFGFFTLGTSGNPSKIATSFESCEEITMLCPTDQHPTGWYRCPTGFHHQFSSRLPCQLSKKGDESKPMKTPRVNILWYKKSTPTIWMWTPGAITVSPKFLLILAGNIQIFAKFYP